MQTMMMIPTIMDFQRAVPSSDTDFQQRIEWTILEASQQKTAV